MDLGCEKNDWKTGVKTLPYPKLLLQVVKRDLTNVICAYVRPVADLHSKILDAAPPPESKFFQFHAVFGKFGKIVCIYAWLILSNSSNLMKTSLFWKQKLITVADVHGKILELNSFNFTQFLGKFGQIGKPPWRIGVPTSMKSWIRHWIRKFRWKKNFVLLLLAHTISFRVQQWCCCLFVRSGWNCTRWMFLQWN